MKKISFSVITPTYNRLKSGYLEECINSVAKQTSDSFEYEHIIVDDRSTDKTKGYLKEKARLYSHIKLVLLKKNQGTSKAVQAGIKAAKNKFIIIIGDDDMLTKDSLKFRANYIRKHPKIDFFYAKSKRIDSGGKIIRKKHFQSDYYTDFLYERILIYNRIHGGTPTTRTTIIKTLDWPSWLKRSDDIFIWLELLKPERKLNIGFLDEFVFLYRDHSDSFTNQYHRNEGLKLEKRMINERLKKERHPEGLVFLAMEANRYVYKIVELGKENKRLKAVIKKLKEKNKK